MAQAHKADRETYTFEVFSNGEFWGHWDAETEEDACKLAADEVGTDGNTEGMTAKQISA